MRDTAGGVKVCSMRLACNGRRKNSSTGEWEDQPNYFDVTCFGSQAENCGRFLAKGRPIAVDGRLDWREWEQDGQKRQAVQVIADTVQFLSDGRRDGDSGQSGAVDGTAADSPPPVAAGSQFGDDDDIPF